MGRCSTYTGICCTGAAVAYLSLYFLKRLCGRAVSAPDFRSRVADSNPAGGEILPEPKRTSLHRAFHVHPSIVLKWLKYCWRDVKTLTRLSFISSFFFLSNFQYWNFSSHVSQELWCLEDWNMVHTWTVGRCIMFTVIRLLLLIHPFISSFFSLQFSNIKIFHRFSQELWDLEDWNLVHKWTVGRCIVCTGIRLLLLIHPFISSFFFLSNFQTLTFFVTLFSGTARSRRLKLGTHVDSGQTYRVWADVSFVPEMYRVYRNQAAAAYLSLYCIFFLSHFQTLKFFITILSGTMRPRRLKLGTHVDSGWIYRVYQNQAAAVYSSLYFFFLQYSNIKTCIPESGCCCVFIPLFFLSPIFKH